MSEENTSGGASATQVPPTTETVTPATPASATQQKPDATVEELHKRIAELEHSHGNAKEELDRHRKKLTAYEKKEAEAEAARKAAEEAQLSELERTQKQFSELQAQYEQAVQDLREERLQAAVLTHATKLNFIYPEVAGKLISRNELEYDEHGKPKNVDALLEKVAKSMPDLVRKEQQQQQTPPQGQASQAAQAGQQPRAPVIPPFSGRSSIPTPGTTPPGTRMTLQEYHASKRQP